MTLTPDTVASMIDHSLLHPVLTDRELAEGCRLAARYGCATVCIKPYAVSLAVSLLQNSPVKVCTVVAFPHGSSSVDTKLFETTVALGDGAQEIDMVINIGKALEGDWKYTAHEIETVFRKTRDSGALLKVIFETDYLQDAEIGRLCEICSEVGVDFVKTSTGFGFVKNAQSLYSYAGATEHNLRLMRAGCTDSVQIKAAGGVRDLATLLRFHSIGVTRFGATATAAIIEEAKRNLPAT
jgi:deoxyribose-phosphate aldolase